MMRAICVARGSGGWLTELIRVYTLRVGLAC